MLLVQLHGPAAGQRWAPVAARRMLARAGKRAGLGIVKPHAFRHSFTSAVLDAAGGNLLIARDAAAGRRPRRSMRSTGTSMSIDPAFGAALRTVWGEAR